MSRPRSGGAVLFPQDGPTNSIITRINASQFNLLDIGFYEINFQVSITEPCQLVIVLNGSEIPSTIVGRATGTCQVVGMSIIQTLTANSIISINNALGNTTALTITPFAGGVQSVSAHLVIKQIQ